MARRGEASGNPAAPQPKGTVMLKSLSTSLAARGILAVVVRDRRAGLALGHGAGAGHLVRRVRVHRRRAAGRGACGAVSTISMPMEAKTASKAAPDFASRPPIIGRRDRPGQLDGRILDQDRHRRSPAWAAGRSPHPHVRRGPDLRIHRHRQPGTTRQALDLPARLSVRPLTSTAEPCPARNRRVAAHRTEAGPAGRAGNDRAFRPTHHMSGTGPR
jgi:hypothetical protein